MYCLKTGHLSNPPPPLGQVGYDTAGNYAEARPLYFKAAEILHRISAVEVNPVRKQAFRDKVGTAILFLSILASFS